MFGPLHCPKKELNSSCGFYLPTLRIRQRRCRNRAKPMPARQYLRNENRVIQGGPETLMNLPTPDRKLAHAVTLPNNLAPSRAAKPSPYITINDGRPHAVDPPVTLPQGLISRGRVEALDFVPFHANGAAPVNRRVLAGAGVHENLGKHIVSHEIFNVPAARRSYCEPHVHDCDDINILLSESYLSTQIRLGDEVFVVNAPATIRILRGGSSANVIEGTGFYIAIVDTANYKASVGSGTVERREATQSTRWL